jgi:hypothetical protein
LIPFTTGKPLERIPWACSGCWQWASRRALEPKEPNNIHINIKNLDDMDMIWCVNIYIMGQLTHDGVIGSLTDELREADREDGVHVLIQIVRGQVVTEDRLHNHCRRSKIISDGRPGICNPGTQNPDFWKILVEIAQLLVYFAKITQFLAKPLHFPNTWNKFRYFMRNSCIILGGKALSFFKFHWFL